MDYIIVFTNTYIVLLQFNYTDNMQYIHKY